MGKTKGIYGHEKCSNYKKDDLTTVPNYSDKYCQQCYQEIEVEEYYTDENIYI